jgi:FxsC-like protein
VLYFFLSYARGDDDLFVQKFYTELCAELRTKAGTRGSDDQIGFFDSSSIGVGQDWSAQLVEALSSCQVMLSLCTPAYFGSEPCGREFQVFADRSAAYERTTGKAPSALLPVLWLPLPEKKMHPMVASLQNHTERLGEPYKRGGLRQLMRLQRNQDAYLEFLSELADLVIGAAEEHPIPELRKRLTFSDVRSAFHQPVTKDDRILRSPEIPGVPASQYVHIVVAAPTRTEIAGLRRQDVFYGDHSTDWAPYQPAFPFPLGRYALGIATERSFQAEVVTIEGLSERIDAAVENNQIVVLLVDAWVTRLDNYREALARYSEREQTRQDQTTAVMIPWNHNDSETQEHAQELTRSIRGVFYRRMAGGEDVMYRTSVLTHDAFGADLRVVLEVAKNHMFVRGKVYRRPVGEDPGERPILEGP